jgi:D-alanyl-D-alanine carboxypeptidase/D-alanyl-D-alanine-endopeptidase (penicillin-binding protein 4)
VVPGPRSRLARRLAEFTAEVARVREAHASKRAQAPEPDLTSAAGPPAAFDVVGLAAEIGEIVERLERSTDVSVHIRELASDDVLFDFHGDAPLNPASNHKLLTTAAALDLLGPEFRFETRALRVGDALYVIGEGDPTLDELGLRAMAGEIAAATELATLRRVVVDDLAFSPRTLAPGFNDEGVGVSFQAPSGALSLNFNTVEVTVRAPRALKKKPGQLAAPRGRDVPAQHPRRHRRPGHRRPRRPEDPHLRGAWRSTSQARTVVELTGKLRAGSSLMVRRRVVDPGLFTGGALAVQIAGRTDGTARRSGDARARAGARGAAAGAARAASRRR